MAGFLGSSALWLAYPLALLATGFFTPGERSWLAGLRHPDEVARRLSALRHEPVAVEGTVPGGHTRQS